MTDKILIRQASFAEAKKMVDPIVEQHGLTEVSHTHFAFNISRISPAQQHVDLIIQVADWMMEDG